MASWKLESCQSLSHHADTSHIRWCVQTSDSAVASNVAGRGMQRESRCRWSLGAAVNWRHLISWCLSKANLNYSWTKGPSHHAQTSEQVIWTLKLPLHFICCVVSLHADQLCTQIKPISALTGTHTEVSWQTANLCLSPPLILERITTAFTALNISLPWTDT